MYLENIWRITLIEFQKFNKTIQKNNGFRCDYI
jgi:hypothetical protein